MPTVTVVAKPGPSISRHNSNQDVRTPADFMAAVTARFGTISFDLAASEHNTQHPKFFSEANNALTKDWHKIGGLLWLNPPFNDIAPWAAKCEEESSLGARILFLVPGSIGTNWFADHVHRKASVYALRPRLTFDGHKDPYPKDLILCDYGGRKPIEPWKWK